MTERSLAAISSIVPVGLLGSTFAGYVLSGLSQQQPNYWVYLAANSWTPFCTHLYRSVSHPRMNLPFFSNSKKQTFLNDKIPKMCDPIIVNPVVKMRAHPAAHPYTRLRTCWRLCSCLTDTTPDSFSCRQEKLCDLVFWSNGTELEQVVHTHRNIMLEWIRGFASLNLHPGGKSPPHLWIFSSVLFTLLPYSLSLRSE